jgi:hypothetical protein
MVVLPQCPDRSCRKNTKQIVGERTETPHFSRYSMTTVLNMYAKERWLQPVNPAQVQEWRDRLASGKVWFDWPDYDMETRSYKCLSPPTSVSATS